MKPLGTMRLVIVFAAITTLIACGHGPGNTGSIQLKVGYIPIVDCLPLYVAKQKGFFEKRGINAELTPLQGGPIVLQALTAKSVDIGYSNVASVIIARSQGIPIVGISGGPIENKNRQAHALLVLDSSPLRSAKDLAGKTIAMNALRNIEYVILTQYLEKNGVDPTSVKTIEAPVPQLEGLLKNGTADAIMQVEPFVTLATNDGTARILGHPYTDNRERNIIANYNARPDWADGNLDTCKKFNDALAEANDFIAKNDAEARQILIKYTKVPDEVVNKVTLPESMDKFEPADMQFWIDELTRQKIIENPVSASDLLKQF